MHYYQCGIIMEFCYNSNTATFESVYSSMCVGLGCTSNCKAVLMASNSTNKFVAYLILTWNPSIHLPCLSRDTPPYPPKSNFKLTDTYVLIIILSLWWGNQLIFTNFTCLYEGELCMINSTTLGRICEKESLCCLCDTNLSLLLQRAQWKALDVLYRLGLSNFVLRLIERCNRTDR